MKAFNTTRKLLLACSIAVLLSGCGSSSAADTGIAASTVPASIVTASTATSTSTTGTATNSTGLVAGTATLLPLTVAETDTLLFVREEEKMARDVYLTLYSKWGQRIFDNIATRSEQQHMDTMKLLVDSLGLVDPVVSDAVGDFTNPTIDGLYDQLVARGSASYAEGLATGAFIEEFDIKDLQDAIAETMDGTSQLAVIQAYTNLMCGSRNHLRSFVNLLELNGVDYRAQLMPQAEVDLILNTPSEQCGQ